MKGRQEAKTRSAADQLAEVNESILAELQDMIRLVNAQAHPDRIEQEYAYLRNLFSRRRDCFWAKKRADGRCTQCTGLRNSD